MLRCRAREWVATEFGCNVTAKVSLFETNIRIVGGLIGAYDLSGDKMFLDKAVHCVDMMLPIFETSPTGEQSCAPLCSACAAATSQFSSTQNPL